MDSSYAYKFWWREKICVGTAILSMLEPIIMEVLIFHSMLTSSQSMWIYYISFGHVLGNQGTSSSITFANFETY